MTPRPVAWMVIDSRGRRSVYLDHSRAEQQSAQLHGVLVPLGPIGPMPEPNPDEVRHEAGA